MKENNKLVVIYHSTASIQVLFFRLPLFRGVLISFLLKSWCWLQGVRKYVRTEIMSKNQFGTVIKQKRLARLVVINPGVATHLCVASFFLMSYQIIHNLKFKLLLPAFYNLFIALIFLMCRKFSTLKMCVAT